MRWPILGCTTLTMERMSGRGVQYSPPLRPALPMFRILAS
jgi:hypothetical protein